MQSTCKPGWRLHHYLVDGGPDDSRQPGMALRTYATTVSNQALIANKRHEQQFCARRHSLAQSGPVKLRRSLTAHLYITIRKEVTKFLVISAARGKRLPCFDEENLLFEWRSALIRE